MHSSYYSSKTLPFLQHSMQVLESIFPHKFVESVYNLKKKQLNFNQW